MCVHIYIYIYIHAHTYIHYIYIYIQSPAWRGSAEAELSSEETPPADSRTLAESKGGIERGRLTCSPLVLTLHIFVFTGLRKRRRPDRLFCKSIGPSCFGYRFEPCVIGVTRYDRMILTSPSLSEISI